MKPVIVIPMHDPMSMFAEFTLALLDDSQTKDVDWLAWEDPFIFDQNGRALKCAREQSASETQKRLNYALPMLQLLVESTAPKRG